MSIKVDPMRKFLHDLSKNMAGENLEEMKFLLKLPDGVSETLNSSLKLFSHLTKIWNSDEEIIKNLEEIFSLMDREDLKEKVLKYGMCCDTKRQSCSLIQ